ncbi:MAG: transporter [Clostridiales bacterium]|nr:transporter [Clostridiales bacterium]
MKNKLWTKNFTILTGGSLISMMGNAISQFAMGLVIYDHTDSTLLYSLFLIITTLPKIITPMLIGPYIDRSSRKKVIVYIDTIYGFIFTGFAIITYMGFFNYGFYLMFGILLGVLDSIYNVAYESFYPEFITEGNFSKAYSISSLLYPIANTIMIPIAGYAYKWVGVAPLFLFNAGTFFVTQAFERCIEADEKHLQGKVRLSGTTRNSYKTDFKEGVNYLRREKGLLSITCYFFISMLTSASLQTLLLPYFKSAANHSVEEYAILMSISTFGRIVGGLVHYKFKYPTHKKFSIAVFVYVSISLLEGGLLFMSFPFMALAYLGVGLLGVTSFNIRVSGTQSYVPSERRGRFNGLFMMITMLGAMIGQLVTGALGEFFPIENIIAIFMSCNIIGALLIMLNNKEAVKKIYNQSI